MSYYSSNWIRNIFFLLLIIQLAPTTMHIVKKYYDEIMATKTKVGIVTIKGPISDTSVHAQHLKTFFEDESIKAILLKVESPGGFAGASASLNYVIRSLKATHHKPIIGWVQNMCASGGYYIIAATDHIIATPLACIGSVGVYIPQLQLQKMIEAWNVKYDAIHAGKYKTTGNPLLTNTPAQNAMLQQFVDDTYRIFSQDIFESRGTRLTASAQEVFDGKIFTGQRALELGLIDQIGSQIDVELVLKEHAHITNDIAWVKPPQQPHWLKMLTGGDDDSDSEHSYMATFVQALMNHLETKNIQTTL